MNNQTLIFIGGMAVGTIVGAFGYNHYIKKHLESEYLKNALVEALDTKFDKDGVEHLRRNYVQSHNGSSDLYYNKNQSEDSAPHIITPEEFGENEEYDTISLTLYSDGILADDADKPIDDVDEVIDKESLEHFGEYEDDSIFVRNDKLKCDYEVLIDERRYAQILEDKPYLKEG